MRHFSTRAAGLLILVLGVWGGLIPFIGPYFHFALGPTKSWTWTNGRLWLDVLPGIVAALGGLMLIFSGPRPAGRLGAWLALAAGIWFAIGPDVSLLWNSGGAQGAAHGARGTRVLEMVAYHTGLGAVIAALAGYALPSFRRTREVVAEPAAAEPAARDRDAAYAAGAGAHRGRPLAGEPVAAEEEPVARDRATDGVAHDGMAHDGVTHDGVAADRATGDTVGARPANRTVEHEAVAPASEPTGDYANAGGAGNGAAGEPYYGSSTPASSDDGEYGSGGHAGGRRRRGGLLAPFLRR